jgi:hypothetical protein
MDLHPKEHPIIRVGLMPLFVVSIFWALTVAVCPELHDWIHPDAHHEDHDCAVTSFITGGIHFAPIDLLDVAKRFHWVFVDVLHLCSQVLISAQTTRLVPGRGPPGMR